MDLQEIIVDSSHNYKKKMNIPSFFLSSEGNGNVSLTVKGLVVMTVIAALNYYGITADQGQIIDILNQIVALGAGLFTLAGAVRKMKNAIQK